MRAVGIGVLLVLLAACAELQPSCTLIAGRGGVSVRVDAGVAVDRLDLTVCPASAECRTSTVDLTPDQDMVDQGCSGNAPDDVCSATAVPNGGQVGFVEWSDLPIGPLTLTGQVRRNGRTTELRAVTITSTTVFPNGPSCGGQANQARVALGSSGLRAA